MKMVPWLATFSFLEVSSSTTNDVTQPVRRKGSSAEVSSALSTRAVCSKRLDPLDCSPSLFHQYARRGVPSGLPSE